MRERSFNTRAWLIGAFIAGERKRRGWTQEELGKRSGIMRPNINRLEAGRMEPALATLARVALAFEIKLSDIVAAADEPCGAAE